MRLHVRYMIFVMALYICSATLALGASVTVSSTGSGSFVIQGENLNGVAGIDLNLGYDSLVLANPTVSWGSIVSGALSVANTSNPGSIRIAIIRTDPFSGSGPIATLSFAKQYNSGGLTSISAKLIDSKGANIATQASIAPGASGTQTVDSGLVTAAGIPFSQSEPSRGVSAGATTAVPTTTQAGLGTVSMPVDTPSKAEPQPVDPKAARTPEAVEMTEGVPQQTRQPEVEKVAEAIEASEVKQTVYSSVLDRFRIYQGEKSPEILMALMTKAVSATIRQEPAVAVSDGKTAVRVTVDLSAIKGTSTNFAFTGAKLVSLKKEGDTGIWVLEALPQMNTLKASVTMLNSTSVIEFPLTIVPPAAAVSSKRDDFATFLKDSGSKVPKQDLNGDGRHDYLDDFMYTAHYLINSSAAAAKVK